MHFIERISCKLSKEKDINSLELAQEHQDQEGKSKNEQGKSQGEDDEEKINLKLPRFQKEIRLHDWFDTVFITQRIWQLKEANTVSEESGS